MLSSISDRTKTNREILPETNGTQTKRADDVDDAKTNNWRRYIKDKQTKNIHKSTIGIVASTERSGRSMMVRETEKNAVKRHSEENRKMDRTV